jgi:hypothetical protein
MDFFSPNIAYASVDTFISNVNRLILNPLITLLFAVAMVLFLYGMLQFFISADNEEKRSEGKRHMLWGIVGLTIMMGVFGILNILLKTFNITNINPEQGKVEKFPDFNPSYPQLNNK